MPVPLINPAPESSLSDENNINLSSIVEGNAITNQDHKLLKKTIWNKCRYTLKRQNIHPKVSGKEMEKEGDEERKNS